MVMDGQTGESAEEAKGKPVEARTPDDLESRVESYRQRRFPSRSPRKRAKGKKNED